MGGWVAGFGFLGRPSGWVGRGFRVFCADINKGPCGPTAALRAPKSHQTRAGWSCTGLLNNAMSVSHILGVMSCKWPNFTAATAFEIPTACHFFARGAEVGRWVSGFGFLWPPSGSVGLRLRVFCADINKGPRGPTAALRVPKSHQTRAGWSTK